MTDLNDTIASYGAAWRERDAARRLDLLARCFASTGRYTDPSADIRGRDALCRHIGDVLDNFDGRIELTSRPSAHHDVAYFTWHMRMPDGSIAITGHDVLWLDSDGRIAQLAGFFGDPAPLP